MWPFSRSNRVPLELEAWQRDIEQRFKVLEREHDDLHAAYRRIRAAHAREQVAAGPAGPAEAPADSKQALRDRYLSKRIQ
jgi:hypothetical protein